MNKVRNEFRCERLIREAISDMSLDLRGMSVLTEAASGSFALTPLIAALGGAERVFAVTRDSAYGSSGDICEYIESWATKLEVNDRIEITTAAPEKYAANSNIVTNLGFVRPIDANIIENMPPDSVVALMWEPWELRDEDIDLLACMKRHIPVVGTNESHPRLMIFRYVGLLALKLLHETDIEIFRSRILVIASKPFGSEVSEVLAQNGAQVMWKQPDQAWNGLDSEIEAFLTNADAVVIAEHREKDCLVGGEDGIPVDWFRPQKVELIHICGEVDNAALESAGISKHPAKDVPAGHMTLTTDYVGPKPVIDLHAASLKAGEVVVSSLRRFGDSDKAVRDAVESGFGVRI